MIKRIIIAFIFSGTIFAQSAGNNGLTFLKTGFGARNIAMGDIGNLSGGISSVYYNPALVAESGSKSVEAAFNNLVMDATASMMGIGFELLGLDFGVTINTTNIGNIEVRQIAGESVSDFDAHYFAGGITTGFEIMENLSLGGTAKYLYENIFSDEASGWGFDLGAVYHTNLKGLSFGASLRNLGSLSELRNESTVLPLDLRFVSEYNYGKVIENFEADFVAGVQKYLKEDDSHIHLGAELNYKHIVKLRGGYITGYETKGLTAGLGIDWISLSFGYAFLPFDYDLGSTHTISLSYSFN